MSANSLLTGSRDGRRLRIDFERKIDRYQQALWLIAGEREVCVVTTVEGTGQQAWPPSPPLQQLHQHQTPAGNLAVLGVGMAGTSHWSLAVEAGADQPSLCCDVACRVKEVPDDLAVTWELGENVAVNTDSELLVELSTPLGRVRISVGEEDEFAAAIGVNKRLELPGGQIRLSPQRTNAAPPTTFRWRYRIELM
jgi:hypothetical protein